ncbi:MAG TPA: RraA family protein [Spirochaetia bacterium]|nr:RraA family protein [Spirochaetia bacterium]
MTADRRKILDAYKDLRVADVRDGLDCLGYHAQYSMDPTIRPLARMRAYGIAKTCRYLPYQGKIPKLTPEEYWEWSGMYYNKICTYPWVDEIQEGDFIVIDMSGQNVGLMGSENTLNCVRKGARGFVSNGGVRDTDEIIMQKIPFWSVIVSQCMVQGRLQYESHNKPVTVGGVEVSPGDVVMADGDGVVVVPEKLALDVARLANEEHERDKKRRGEHYRALGLKLDDTVT